MAEFTDFKRVPLLFAAPVSVAGGFILRCAYPGPAIWALAFIGTAFILVALWNQKGRHGLWLGAIAGSSLWFPLIDWLTLYLGSIPWAALAGAMVLWFTLMGMAISGVTRRISQRALRPSITIVLQVFVVAGLWVAREGVQSTFPYGGFAWGRLAHTQAEGPMLSLVSYTGFAGLTALMLVLTAIPVAYAFTRGKFFSTSGLVLAGTAVIFASLWVPHASLTVHDTARIAAVQGNSKSGVFDNRENGDVIADHIRVTEEWLDTNPEAVDAVVWPENSAEFGIIQHPKNLAQVRHLADRADAPFAIGSVLGEGTDDQRTYTNSSLVVAPDSDSLQRYDKRHPVPFAEYMPHRSFYRSLVPDLVDMVQLEYEHGVTDTVVDVGGIRAGAAICFDIVFDDMAVAMSEENAEIVFAQTNNADFGQTDQSEQQLFIAKLRAVEMGRTVVNISTVATSEIIAPDGTVLASIPQWQPGVMVAEVPLVSGTTPAVAYGSVVAGGWIAVGLVGSLLTLVRFRHDKSSRTSAARR